MREHRTNTSVESGWPKHALLYLLDPPVSTRNSVDTNRCPMFETSSSSSAGAAIRRSGPASSLASTSMQKPPIDPTQASIQLFSVLQYLYRRQPQQTLTCSPIILPPEPPRKSNSPKRRTLFRHSHLSSWCAQWTISHLSRLPTPPSPGPGALEPVSKGESISRNSGRVSSS